MSGGALAILLLPVSMPVSAGIGIDFACRNRAVSLRHCGSGRRLHTHLFRGQASEAAERGNAAWDFDRQLEATRTPRER